MQAGKTQGRSLKQRTYFTGWIQSKGGALAVWIVLKLAKRQGGGASKSYRTHLISSFLFRTLSVTTIYYKCCSALLLLSKICVDFLKKGLIPPLKTSSHSASLLHAATPHQSETGGESCSLLNPHHYFLHYSGYSKEVSEPNINAAHFSLLSKIRWGHSLRKRDSWLHC